ncbi:FecR domain-containing protein [Xanthomonas populi]|uniref:FecR domain-containing protein n=1 Tax=Xanthomonas populi TaxID=53414 RepID=UPI001FCA3465|nr:FecR domain-containing protein [Xanthomonas populi]
MTLNTRSAIDVGFDAQQRLLQLPAGDIMVTTGHALGAGHDARPFVVRTAQGDLGALGTRFCVRQDEGDTQVSVLESAVEVRLLAAPQALGRVKELLAACPATVGGQGPCSQAADHPL